MAESVDEHLAGRFGFMTNKQRDIHLGRGTWALLGALASGLCIWAGTGWQTLTARAAVAPSGAFKSGAQIRLSDDELPPQDASPTPEVADHPEALLLTAYRLVGQGQLGQALKVSEQLVRSYPEFKLGQLLQADLLAAHSQPLPSFGISGSEPGRSSPDALAGLRAEAMARLAALADRPPVDSLPAEFVRLSASVPFALAVDTTHSRMFLFEQSASGWRLREDFYVSVGKRGVGKQTEGDQRTPLGVYFTLSHVPEGRLDERFGAGALPLNYPNALDKQLGRTGSGILLHGVPSSTYSRPPQDSDGCVAMSNHDLRRLAALLPPRDTPVVITKGIHWVKAEQRTGPPEDFASTWARWQAIRQGKQEADITSLYTATALNPTETDTDQRSVAATQRFRERLSAPADAIQDVSMLTWHDDSPTMVVTFRERITQGKRREQGVRQYWSRDKDGWRIVAEGPLR